MACLLSVVWREFDARRDAHVRAEATIDASRVARRSRSTLRRPRARDTGEVRSIGARRTCSRWRLRGHVCAYDIDERAVSDTRPIHHHWARPAGLGVLRLPRHSSTEIEEDPVCAHGGLLDPEHGPSRAAHQRRLRKDVHGLAARGEAARPSLLSRPRGTRDRNGADRTRGRSATSVASNPAHDRPSALSLDRRLRLAARMLLSLRIA